MVEWFSDDDQWRETYEINFHAKKLEAAGIELRAHFGVVCSHRKEIEI